jgi:hypothetical protein
MVHAGSTLSNITKTENLTLLLLGNSDITGRKNKKICIGIDVNENEKWIRRLKKNRIEKMPKENTIAKR